MIFVAAGTQDGRELTKLLLDAGHRVTASVVSHYGEQLLKRCGSERLTINDKPLDREALESYLRGDTRGTSRGRLAHRHAARGHQLALVDCVQTGGEGASRSSDRALHPADLLHE